MSDENSFRWFALIGVMAISAISLNYRLRARTGEQLDRRQEGLLRLVALRILGLVWGGGLIAYLIDPQWMEWARLSLPAWLRWAGGGLSVVVLVLHAWTFHSLGRNLTDTVVTRRENSLVVHGPYRWVRHPFYSCCALGMFGMSLLTANWFLLGLGAAVVGLLFQRTGVEERNLVARHGDAYREYQRRTGRFLPRIV